MFTLHFECKVRSEGAAFLPSGAAAVTGKQHRQAFLNHGYTRKEFAGMCMSIGHGLVRIDSDEPVPEIPEGRAKMSILKSEAERARAQYANLVKHYRAIGPAAVAAALAASKKKKKPLPTPVKV